MSALPAIELRTLDGRPARLDEIARGRPALVSLWATWCEACAREFDALGQNRVPATVVLDREGRVVFRGGVFDEAALAAFRRAFADGVSDGTGRARAAAR